MAGIKEICCVRVVVELFSGGPEFPAAPLLVDPKTVNLLPIKTMSKNIFFQSWPAPAGLWLGPAT